MRGWVVLRAEHWSSCTTWTRWGCVSQEYRGQSLGWGQIPDNFDSHKPCFRLEIRSIFFYWPDCRTCVLELKQRYLGMWVRFNMKMGKLFHLAECYTWVFISSSSTYRSPPIFWAFHSSHTTNKLAARWPYLFSYKFGLQVALLALPWIALLASALSVCFEWYFHQPESHQLSLNKICQWVTDMGPDS